MPPSRYRLRRQLPEPVFGQIKHARGFRQSLLRGFEIVRAEWATIAVMARDKLLAFLTRRDIEATNTSPAAPLAVIRYALAALRPSEPPPHQVDRGD